MDKKLRIKIIIIFAVLSVLLSFGIYNIEDEKANALMDSPRIVYSQEELDEALNSDGYVFVKGSFEGAIDLNELRDQGMIIGDNPLDNIFTSKKEIEELTNKAINYLKSKGDFLEVSLKIGKIRRNSEGSNSNKTLYEVDQISSVFKRVDSVNFLKYKFVYKELLFSSGSGDTTIISSKKLGDLGYQIRYIKSPKLYWMSAIVKNKELTDITFYCDEYHQRIINSDKVSERWSAVMGFIIFWWGLCFPLTYFIVKKNVKKKSENLKN